MPTSDNVATLTPHPAASGSIILADWDNTLCSGYTGMPWAEYLETAGLFRGARTLQRLLDDAHRGAFPTYDMFCDEMAKAYAAGIIGTSERAVRTAAKAFVTTDSRRLFGFVRDLFTYLRERGLPVVVITGAPDEPMQEYAARLGFSLAGTFQLEVQDGCYTGNVACNSGLCEKKREAVRRIVPGRRVLMAFGDSTADVPLWESAWASAGTGFIVVSEPRTQHEHPNLVPIDVTLPVAAIMQLVKGRMATHESTSPKHARS